MLSSALSGVEPTALTTFGAGHRTSPQACRPPPFISFRGDAALGHARSSIPAAQANSRPVLQAFRSL